MDELMATESDIESEKSKRAVVKAERANPECAKLCKKAQGFNLTKVHHQQNEARSREALQKGRETQTQKVKKQVMEVLDDSSRVEAQLSPYEPNLVLTRGILI